ncbi:hypothetical protein [Janthinobacterium fluminis]|uniref:Uncharacterized protein n=1 Tax=Janthinobacterium fluminis TaxID=2987524 RepID=A0ABT5JU00_9BURK|nr:hypothetical protein [Janthinobacterium fluminis]MDC8756232.1 hypothetical protein [Janthinobacterium fluminis]
MERPEPDRAALEIAHRALQSKQPLDEMLRHPGLALILKLLARRHVRRRMRIDVKKLQSNDYD